MNAKGFSFLNSQLLRVLNVFFVMVQDDSRNSSYSQ